MKIGLGRNKIEQTLLDKKINQMKKNLKKYGFKSNKSSTKRWKRTQREQKQKNYTSYVKKKIIKEEKKKTPGEEKIEKFFEECDLTHLTKIFLNNGFDELDILYEVERDHMTEMEISLQDQQKLFDNIYKRKKKTRKFESILDRVSKSKKSTDTSVENIEEEIAEEEPTNLPGFGNFRKSSTSFRIKRPESGETNTSTFIISSESIENRKKLIETKRRNEKSLQVGSEAVGMRPKATCWNCYKQFYVEEDENGVVASDKGKKAYCSLECEAKDMKLTLVQCLKCGIKVRKKEALRFDGGNYCSSSCKPELKEMASDLKKFVEKNKIENQDTLAILTMYKLENQDFKEHVGHRRSSKTMKRKNSILKKSRKNSARSIKRVSFDSETVFDRPPSSKRSRRKSRGFEKLKKKMIPDLNKQVNKKTERQIEKILKIPKKKNLNIQNRSRKEDKDEINFFVSGKPALVIQGKKPSSKIIEKKSLAKIKSKRSINSMKSPRRPLSNQKNSRKVPNPKTATIKQMLKKRSSLKNLKTKLSKKQRNPNDSQMDKQASPPKPQRPISEMIGRQKTEFMEANSPQLFRKYSAGYHNKYSTSKKKVKQTENYLHQIKREKEKMAKEAETVKKSFIAMEIEPWGGGDNSNMFDLETALESKDEINEGEDEQDHLSHSEYAGMEEEDVDDVVVG